MTHVRNESNRLPTRDGLSNLRAHQLIPATAAAAAAGRCRIEIEFEMQILKLLSAIGWPEFSFACERARTHKSAARAKLPIITRSNVPF